MHVGEILNDFGGCVHNGNSPTLLFALTPMSAGLPRQTIDSNKDLFESHGISVANAQLRCTVDR